MTGNSSKIRVIFWAKAFFAALGSFLGVAGLSAESTSAASLKLLWSFCAVVSCNDGKFPLAGPIIDGKGNLYGTASYGGGGNNGVMFFLPPTKSFKVLHAFGAGGGLAGADGGNPEAPLLGTGTGNLYGTTFYGGSFGVGTVFVRSPSGVYTVVHSFTRADGSAPAAGLIADASGNFYGTTSGGGANTSGTIFKIAPGGALTTLHSFCSMTGCPDGYNPVAGLFLEEGNLYGTTFNGGGSLSLGVVFKIRTDGSKYTVLHTFMGGPSDGGSSDGRLSADASGNLYGTTHFGGANGRGTVFKIASDGSTYAVLYNFCSLASCTDGSEPIGGVIIDANHNLYGTTELGGTKNLGVVFALTPSSGSERVLYSFCNQTNCLDGSTPAIGLTFDASGNLYGATTYGGAMNAGIVYKLTNTGFVPPGTAALVP